MEFFRKLLRPKPADRAEELVDHFISVGKSLRAQTAREAAEMAHGRELTDAEWEALRSTWDRRWY